MVLGGLCWWEGKEWDSPAVQIVGVTWRSARSVWGASSGQGAGFGQQQRTVSSSEAWLDKGANSCVYSRGDYRVTPPVRVI